MPGYPTKVGDLDYINFPVIDSTDWAGFLSGEDKGKILLKTKGYGILKYQLKQNHLIIWKADDEFIRQAIQAGRIAGRNGGPPITSDSESLQRFLKTFDKEVFRESREFTKVN